MMSEGSEGNDTEAGDKGNPNGDQMPAVITVQDLDWMGMVITCSVVEKL